MIEEELMSIGTDFEIDEINATIEEEHFSIGTNFIMKIDGTVYAKAEETLLSFGHKYVIYDGSRQTVGYVEETLTLSLFSYYSSYKIFDKTGRLIGRSEKHQLFSTEFIVKDISGNIICEISRPALNMGDNWTVDFRTTKYDKRLFIFIPYYKTLADNEDD